MSKSIIDGMKLFKLSEKDGLSLEVEFTKEKIKEAIWICNDNKSLGPDGFSFSFL